MKKLIVLTLASIAISSCATMGTTNNAAANSAIKNHAATANAKMQACMLTEATAMLADGSIYTQKFKTTARSISKICAEKLAIEGLPEEYQALAEVVVNSVKAGKAAAAENK
ncbi:MAG: hypothetical protein K5838_06835 [Elusimicrobiales bacterium]|nr:hypothetical protein [Elusimicrobiales bacterium]